MTEECPICLEDLFRKTERVRLGCGHMYHRHCLRAFFQNKQLPICPYCRSEVVACDSTLKLSIDACLLKMVCTGGTLSLDPDCLYQDFCRFSDEACARCSFASDVACLSTLDKGLLKSLLDERLKSLLDRRYLLETADGYQYLY